MARVIQVEMYGVSMGIAVRNSSYPVLAIIVAHTLN